VYESNGSSLLYALPACLPRPDAGPVPHLQRRLGARLCRQGDGVQANCALLERTGF
jgi:hypothetical protein